MTWLVWLIWVDFGVNFKWWGCGLRIYVVWFCWWYVLMLNVAWWVLLCLCLRCCLFDAFVVFVWFWSWVLLPCLVVLYEGFRFELLIVEFLTPLFLDWFLLLMGWLHLICSWFMLVILVYGLTFWVAGVDCVCLCLEFGFSLDLMCWDFGFVCLLFAVLIDWLNWFVVIVFVCWAGVCLSYCLVGLLLAYCWYLLW